MISTMSDLTLTITTIIHVIDIMFTAQVHDCLNGQWK